MRRAADLDLVSTEDVWAMRRADDLDLVSTEGIWAMRRADERVRALLRREDAGAAWAAAERDQVEGR